MKRSQFEDIYMHFLHSAKSFKELVCDECGYSESTFYRKMVSGGSGLSRSERASILEMAEIVVEKLTECINAHK